MKFSTRISNFLDDLMRLWRGPGFLAVCKHVRERLFERSENLLYEFRETGLGYELPAGWTVLALRSAMDPGVESLRRSGGPLKLENFRRQAVAYVLCIDGEPVAHRWHLPESPLARRLGAGTAYFGNTFVRPEWRGRQLSGQLLAHMAAQLPRGSRIVMEVEFSNVACQKCLAKAGCLLVGRLRSVVCLARLVSVRIDPWPTQVRLGQQEIPTLGKTA